MKTFTMYRRLDIYATHDTNQVNPPSEPQFEGVVFSDGSCAIRWMTAKRSTSVWACFDDMMAIHGHPEYGSELVWESKDGNDEEEKDEESLVLPKGTVVQYAGFPAELQVDTPVRSRTLYKLNK